MSVAPEPVNSDHDPMTIDPSNLGSVDPLSVEGIFLVALGKQGDERAAFLAQSCPDAEQRQRVDALLAAYESAGSFLEKPAIAMEPTPVGQYLAPCEVPGSIGKLGPYEILEEIGRGGMGVVFRAHDPKLQRIVAVKALAPELARLPSARQRFLREARAAAAISHPHVVTIFAVDGTEEASLGTERTTLPYLVMECIVGQTLHDKIKRVGALKVEEIVRISRQIAEGLAAAHKRGLIHRDIKPANILLENGVERVKITDFGLARTTSDGGITHTGEILGTPQCMSPEQARGEIVDQRSDLFSLGCVMYTMCTGVSPFRADNMLAVMKKVCESEPRPVAQLNPNVPEWLCTLVHQLLEKEPERRVQTAGEVVEVLESRVVATSDQAATSRHVVDAPQTASGSVPKWMETPIIPGLEQWLFQDSLLPVALIAMGIGFFLGEDSESRILMLPILGAIGLGVLTLLKVWRKAAWNWINWKSMISVPLGMFLGGVGRAWLIHRSRSGVGLMEELARNNAGWFIFPLALAIFWFLNRYFRGLFIQNPPSASEAQSSPLRPTHWSTWGILGMTLIVLGMLAFAPSRHGASPSIMEPLLIVYAVALNLWIFVHLVAWGVRLAGSKERAPQAAYAAATVAPAPTVTVRTPRSPWSVLGWILVTILGVGMFGAVLFVIALIVPWMAMSKSPMPYASYVIRIPGAENLKYVTINGEQATLLPGGPGEWRIPTTPGSHNIYVAYSSDSTLNQERFFTTTAIVEQGLTTVVAAEPVMVRSLTPTPGVEAPTLPQPLPQPSKVMPAEGMAFAATGTMGMPSQESTASAPASIPLADAVEVLTDTATMPAPPLDPLILSGKLPGVWIDEPGLLIRLKRLDFEGTEEQGEEFYTKVDWGTGTFLRPKDNSPYGVELLPGRYRVLVQDLDYGWALDRRGTITLGSGRLYIHVKRSFKSHVLQSSGTDQFPLPFRWAGKTYQIHTPEEVQHVNILLSNPTGDKAIVKDSPMFAVIQGFQDRQFVADAVETNPSDGSLRLKRQRTLASIDIQSADMQAGFMSPLGRIEWKGPHQSLAGFFVPRLELRGFAKDELIGWGSSSGWYDNRPIATDDPLAAPWVVRRDRARVKRFAETGPGEGGENAPINTWFHWFGISSNEVLRKSVPAVRRLVTAWADGQPDVPEAELLQLGGAASFEELWLLRTPVAAQAAENVAPAATTNEKEESKAVEPKPEFVPPAFLVPGSTPGTWRMKEPPEGAVVDAVSSPASSTSSPEFLQEHTKAIEKIPLGEAVEILTDPSLLPLRETSGGNFQSLSVSGGYPVNVWIDEPGLHVSLKRLDFEGQGKSAPEFFNSNYWGVGEFRAVEEPGVALGSLEPGSYSVVVHDIAYGWNLERQGTITLGSGPTTIHVKRLFEGQQVNTQWPFPIPFRWAGKTYQIRNVNERLAVNDLLRLLDGPSNVRITKVSETYNIIHSISEGRFVAEAVQTDPADGSLSLRRDVIRASIEIQSPGMVVGLFANEKNDPGRVKTGLGEVVFRGPYTSGLFPIPAENVEGYIRDERLDWGVFSGPYQGTQDLDAAVLTAGPFQARRDRAWMKHFAEMPIPESVQSLTLHWFDDTKSLARSSLPATRRLITAYADGNPDVSEAELLVLGDGKSPGNAKTWEELWAVPDIAPEETMQAIIVPGSAPGTWRIKEPPEGAVVQE